MCSSQLNQVPGRKVTECHQNSRAPSLPKGNSGDGFILCPQRLARSHDNPGVYWAVVEGTAPSPSDVWVCGAFCITQRWIKIPAGASSDVGLNTPPLNLFVFVSVTTDPRVIHLQMHPVSLPAGQHVNACASSGLVKNFLPHSHPYCAVLTSTSSPSFFLLMYNVCRGCKTTLCLLRGGHLCHLPLSFVSFSYFLPISGIIWVFLWRSSNFRFVALS